MIGLTDQELARLQCSIDSWYGTPYLPGNQTKGKQGGVDCVRFIDAVLSEALLPDQELSPLPRWGGDAAFHDPEKVKEMAALLSRRFDMRYQKLVKYRPCMGDVIAVRMRRGSPPRCENLEALGRHLLIVGTTPMTCYHAVPSLGVVEVGIGGLESSYLVTGVYRRVREP